MAYWFDILTGKTSNGTAFPYSFGYSSLRFASDSSLWLASGEGYAGTDSIAVLMPSVLKTLGVSPAISFIGGSANGASSFAPGQLVSIYGKQLGASTGSGAQIGAGNAVTTSNAGTTVLFDNVPAPILYAGASQVNTAIPCSLAGQISTNVTVAYQGAQSRSVTIPLSIAAPGIFTLNGTGTGEAAVVNQDYTLNGPSNPAARGSAIAIYATGIGATSPCIDGQIYQSGFPGATLPVSVGVGSFGAQVLYSGQAPGLVSGVAQINVLIPNDAPIGAVPLTISVGGTLSPSGPTINVK
jgi:uncharacterized protein (TIGR03437 family)